MKHGEQHAKQKKNTCSPVFEMLENLNELLSLHICVDRMGADIVKYDNIIMEIPIEDKGNSWHCLVVISYYYNIEASTVGSDPKSSPAIALPLQDRVAIVTGSSRGIGRAIALHLASLGARLVVNYVSSSSAQADLVTAQINTSAVSTTATGSLRAIAFRADVSDPEQVKALFDTAEQAFSSPVHILVNSAGISDPNYPTIANTSLEVFDQLFSVNARGSFLCCREAANRVKRGGGGRIILISSTAVKAAAPGLGAYTVSKAAVEAMTKILAKELRGSGISVNCIAPGATATDMFYKGMKGEAVKKVIESCPMGRLGETKDTASFVGFLASDDGEWINGQIILVNGGVV